MDIDTTQTAEYVLEDLSAEQARVFVQELLDSGEARRLRVEVAGLKLRYVALVLGVVVGTVSRWENGVRRPSAKDAVRYADLLREWGAQS